MTIKQLIDKLYNWGKLERTEDGEEWVALAELLETASYHFPDTPIEKEIIKQAEKASNEIDKHYVIVRKEHKTYTTEVFPKEQDHLYKEESVINEN